KRVDDALAEDDADAAVRHIQDVLDPYALAVVTINPESRVKVARGPARAELLEAGTRLVLVKGLHQAGVTAPLAVTSPNSGRVAGPSWATGSPEPPQTVTKADVLDRWADISIYRTEPEVYSRPVLGGRLSGFAVEYQILQVYSRDRG